MAGGCAESCEILQIGAGKGAFTINVGAKKGGAEGFEGGHDFLRMKRDGFAPSVGGDFSFVSVESDDDFFDRNGSGKCAKEPEIESAFCEDGAANDDLRCADFCQLFGARDGADASTYADIHSVFAAGAFAQRCDEGVVVVFVHGGVQIDDVQPFVVAEFVELRVYVGNGEFAAAAVDELDGLAGLEIDAGDQHGRRTSIFWEARNCLRARMDWMLS